MLHRFLLVSSENGSEPVTGAKPEVSILPPGDGDWTSISAGKIKELGHGWYRADLGDWNGDERLIVNASAAGALDWRDLVDLDRANLVTAANAAAEAATAAKGASDAAADAQKAAGSAQASAAASLQTATATSNEALALLREIQNGDGSAPSRPEIVAKNPAAWAFHDPGNAFSRKNVGDGVELTCNRAPSQSVQLYDFEYALAAGKYQLDIAVEGKAGASFRFEVLQHGSPYYGLGKSPAMTVGGNGKQVLNLKNDNKARFRLWFTGLAKPGDKYLIKSISLKQI